MLRENRWNIYNEAFDTTLHRTYHSMSLQPLTECVIGFITSIKVLLFIQCLNNL